MLLSTVNPWGTQGYFSPAIDYSCPEWFRMFKSQVCLVSQLEVQKKISWVLSVKVQYCVTWSTSRATDYGCGRGDPPSLRETVTSKKSNSL